jgi:hypothetical protein
LCENPEFLCGLPAGDVLRVTGLAVFRIFPFLVDRRIFVHICAEIPSFALKSRDARGSRVSGGRLSATGLGGISVFLAGRGEWADSAYRRLRPT